MRRLLGGMAQNPAAAHQSLRTEPPGAKGERVSVPEYGAVSFPGWKYIDARRSGPTEGLDPHRGLLAPGPPSVQPATRHPAGSEGSIRNPASALAGPGPAVSSRGNRANDRT